MDKTKNEQRDQNLGSMINQKTNEDYNKEIPNPNSPNFKDPNQNHYDENMENSDPKKAKSGNEAAMKTYTCSMHPEINLDKPGKCPKCGMELIERK